MTKIDTRPNRQGFTLVEVLIAVSIFGLVSIGIIAFLFQGTKMFYNDRATLGIVGDVRKFTSQIDTDAVASNYFCLYTDFNSITNPPLEDGQIGDFVAFIYTDPTGTSGTNNITDVVVYFRDPDTTTNMGPVHRYKYHWATPVDPTSTTIPALLNSILTQPAASYPVVATMAQGLADTSTGTASTRRLFYNYRNCSVMIDGQISESLNDTESTQYRLGNTYNFSVSPRG